MKREEGYYWVAWYTDSKLMVAFWSASEQAWLLDGTDDLHSDRSFTFIAKNKIPEPDIIELEYNPNNNAN